MFKPFPWNDVGDSEQNDGFHCQRVDKRQCVSPCLRLPGEFFFLALTHFFIHTSNFDKLSIVDSVPEGFTAHCKVSNLSHLSFRVSDLAVLTASNDSLLYFAVSIANSISSCPIREDPEHRRCIAAGLVKIVYLLETNPNQASQLCCLLQFDVKETIVDNHDKSIHGAVLQWSGKPKAGPRGPPSEVVAFRGTLLRPKNVLQDLILDLKVATAHLESLGRGYNGLQFLKECLKRNGCKNIWIAGHSLGAAIALAISRKLERNERHDLEAHLFNPPFVSPTFPQLKAFEKIAKILVATSKRPPSFQCNQLEEINKCIQGTSEALAIEMGLKDERKLLELCNDFLSYSDWVPNLYVNEKDPICLTYLHYFKVWKGIYEQKSHLVHESMKYLFCFEVATKKTPWHIVPSAKVITVARHFFSDHHCIRQWWSKNLQVKSIEYIPPDEITRCNFNILQKSVFLHVINTTQDDKDGDDISNSSDNTNSVA